MLLPVNKDEDHEDNIFQNVQAKDKAITSLTTLEDTDDVVEYVVRHPNDVGRRELEDTGTIEMDFPNFNTAIVRMHRNTVMKLSNNDNIEGSGENKSLQSFLVRKWCGLLEMRRRHRTTLTMIKKKQYIVVLPTESM